MLVIVAGPSNAEWVLTHKASSFNYFSVKNKILEVNSFKNMAGSISSQGKLTFKVDLGSIDTNNAERNIIIQDLFLETQNYQEATLTADLGNNFLHSLVFGKAKHLSVDAQFMFHGVNQEINLDILLRNGK